ncbi:hypothetical protein AQ490_24250 [Wenjunlia vitaminophila]|uniref:Flagellar hook-length control protein FliK n=1 Tax=Wenjunlia vitaminophila TaxID=76728 RepID=A0A0T6LRU3_WENVI|nr:hypothetical protein [Wenjunlia vitaminophila]KRV48649.1 hypothetical protein AQ490_24250 [Wenjunlia vitaminophila]
MAAPTLALTTAFGLLVAASSLALGPSPAEAVDTSRGLPGFCPDSNGVTVVVDFRELGGTTIVRCAVGHQDTGLAALKAAGIQVTGTNRWGESFVCRLENKPGPDSEPCIDTPPADAYWSYWHAANGGSWTYSQFGATNRTPQDGGFEGWSFSLNHDAGEAPAPRVAPRRPTPQPGGSSGGDTGGSTGGTGTSTTSGGGSGGGSGGDAPPATDPGGTAAGGTTAGPGGTSTGPSGTSGTTPDRGDRPRDRHGAGERQPNGGRGTDRKSGAPRPSASRPTPSGSAASAPAGPGASVTPTGSADWTGGEDTTTVQAARDSGVPTGTVVGAGAAAVLAGAAGVTAWRRRTASRVGEPR